MLCSRCWVLIVFSFLLLFSVHVTSGTGIFIWGVQILKVFGFGGQRRIFIWTLGVHSRFFFNFLKRDAVYPLRPHPRHCARSTPVCYSSSFSFEWPWGFCQGLVLFLGRNGKPCSPLFSLIQFAMQEKGKRKEKPSPAGNSLSIDST